MILTIAHTFAYALIQTFGFSIFTLALQRLGRLKRLYRLKAFFFLLLMNAAGTMTYGEAAWQRVTTPIAAALFLMNSQGHQLVGGLNGHLLHLGSRGYLGLGTAVGDDAGHRNGSREHLDGCAFCRLVLNGCLFPREPN